MPTRMQQPQRFLPVTRLLASDWNSWLLYSFHYFCIFVYILSALKNMTRPPVHKTFFSLLQELKAYICLLISGGKLQEHSQASASHVKLDVPAPTAGCDSIALWNRRFEKLGQSLCFLSVPFWCLFFCLLIQGHQLNSSLTVFHNRLRLVSQILLKGAFILFYSFPLHLWPFFFQNY